MKRKQALRIVGGAGAAGALGLASYLLLLRPRHLRWGATEEDIARPMPLDDAVENPTCVTNRAVTIDARPEEVWPWLVQMGETPRGGFYSYAWVEKLMGLEVENADQILPEYQELRVGQALDRAGTLLVKAFEPGSYLVLGPAKQGFFASTWAMGLYPLDERSTRLVSRVRARIDRTPRGLFWRILLDPGQFVMERKMLLEIKKRAESASSERRGTMRAPAPWGGALSPR